ncbi:MAG: cell division protein FtsQ/DivIB [Endomicrobium sp.]|jgi:hypothetical protein|nr:cell division protein FtsQ/DivIB [Endomicrobium sp.]
MLLHTNGLRNIIIKVCFLIALFVLISYSIYRQVFTVNINNIKKIDVIGAYNVKQYKIENLILQLHNNNHKINLIKTKHYILNLIPELKNIKIYRYDDTIIVNLYERVPEVYTICNNGGLLGIDQRGYVFPINIKSIVVNIPKISYKYLQERNKLLTFVKHIKLLSSSFLKNVYEIKFNNIDEIVIKMKNNIIIIWGAYQSNKNLIESKLQRLKMIDFYSNSNIHCVDMSYYCYGKIIVR